jgi:uncharacterized protein YecE (DUF72 family)
MSQPLRLVGTAGWAIPRRWADLAPADGKGLARYARVLNAVEINSSFYRPHAATTYERWAAAVPDQFRFSVKVPKAITHDARLVGVAEPVAQFLGEVSGLGAKLGVLLVQLPGKFEFDLALARSFLMLLRRRYKGDVVFEPRHATWFTPEADALFHKHRIGRVAADPPRGTMGCEPGGWEGVAYYRLHGSPRMYFSPYDQPFLAAIATRVGEHAAAAWCMFDNTGSGAAFENAVRMRDLLSLGRWAGAWGAGRQGGLATAPNDHAGAGDDMAGGG